MISVIMAAYNGANFIRQAIESILNQTYQDFELIIVDDGSTDNTVEIIQSYAAKDPRVRLIQNAHGGANKARNTAIAAAKYPWIACMDADDVAVPERLETQLKAAEAEPDVVVWGSYMAQINAEGKVIGAIQIGPTTREQFYGLDRTKNVIMVVNPTSMFKRDIAMQVGCYDERLKAAQDVELWDRMAEYGPVLTIPKKLLQYRLHGDSISATKFFDQRMLHGYVLARNKAKQEGREISLDEYIHDYNNRPVLERFFRDMHNRGRHHYRTTGVFLSRKQYARAAWSLLLSVVLSPRFSLGRVWNRFFPKRFV